MHLTFHEFGGVAAAAICLACSSVYAAQPYAGSTLNAKPMIVVGDADGLPPITPDDRIDGNSDTSPFAGVVSIFSSDMGGEDAVGFIGSGAAISRRHILTAAHVLDFTGGFTSQNTGTSDTGDGMLDAIAEYSTVVLNAGAPQLLAIDSMVLHPDWHGFNNINGPASEGPPSIHDDLAIITLAEDLPANVPIYNLSDEQFIDSVLIAMVGYGFPGDGVNGFSGGADFFDKRVGLNVASQYAVDDEDPHTARERFQFDFDGPTEDTNSDGLLTLGNDLEATTAPGDSGGPSFTFEDLNGDEIITADELTLFGVNTYGQDYEEFDAPLFGSRAGGMIVHSYLDFINSVIPEPSALGAALMLFPLLHRKRRRMSAR